MFLNLGGRRDTIHDPASNRCPDEPAGNTAYGTRLELWDCNGAPNQRWTITNS